MGLNDPSDGNAQSYLTIRMRKNLSICEQDLNNRNSMCWQIVRLYNLFMDKVESGAAIRQPRVSTEIIENGD